MAFMYIDWHNDRTIPYWNDICDEWDATYFLEKGDDFIVYHNTDNDEYAVYYKIANGGRLCGLVQHFDMYSRLVDTPNDSLSDELYAVIRQKAIDKGFPEHWRDISSVMTWRSLIDMLQTKYADSLDDPARVWVPKDTYFDEFPLIRDVSPYDLDDDKVGYRNNNPLSITLREE